MTHSEYQEVTKRMKLGERVQVVNDRNKKRFELGIVQGAWGLEVAPEAKPSIPQQQLGLDLSEDPNGEPQ